MAGLPPDYNSANRYPTDPYKANASAPYPPPQPAYPAPNQAYPPQNPAYPPPNQAYPPQNPAYGYGKPAGGQPAYGQPASYGQPGYNQSGYGQPAYGMGHANTGYGEPDRLTEPAVPKADDATAQFGGSFSDKAIRRAFVRKVYLILFTQLLVTFGFICVFIFVEPVKHWVQNDGLWFYIVAYVLFLGLYIALVCCPSVRRKSPGNFICLGLFTLAFSYLTGTISSYHDTGIVLMAAGITAAVCLAISIFAIQTKIDFTMCSGLLFVLVMVLFFFGIACMITYYTWGYNHIMNCVWGGLAALVFGLFLIYDTQQVMGGRKYEMSPEEYIYGALQLYIDIVYIFIIILGFSGNSS